MPFDLSIRHLWTPKVLLGGNSSVTIGTGALKRAKTTGRPKVSSPHRYHGDHVLTRTGKGGALVLGRLATAFAPKVPPGNAGNGHTTQAPANADASTTPPAFDESKPPGLAPPSFSARMSTFERCVSEMRGAIKKLQAQYAGQLSTKERITSEVAAIVTQTRLKSDVDKELGKLGKLLLEKSAALKAAQCSRPALQAAIGTLEDEIAQLAKARRTLIEIAIGADFTGLARLDNEPLPTGGVVSGLWSVYNESAGIERDYLAQCLGVQFNGALGCRPLELARMCADFDAGRRITRNDGTQLSATQFQRHVGDLVTVIDELGGNTENGRKTVSELRTLLALINARIKLSQAVLHFETLLDEFNRTFKPPAPPAVNPFPNGFPVSAAMQAISSAFPHSREFGNSGDTRQLEAAATSVAHFSEMIGRGETMPALHGIDLRFDQAVLPLKRAAGADIAVAKLRRDRAGERFPSDALLALLDRTDDQLTVRERAEMLDLVGKGQRSTLAQAREILTRARQDIEQARQAGDAAAVMRHELTLMDKRLSQLLTVDRSNWYKPWTWNASFKDAWHKPNKWGSGRRVASTLAGVKIDAQFMKGLRGQFGKDAGKEVAILAARFAHLQRQTILREQQALGLHEGFEFDGTPAAGEPYREVDLDDPLAHFGISKQDLADIGLAASDIQDIGAVVEQLARQGIAGIEEVQDAVRAINEVSKIVLKSELLQESILVYGMDMARAQGQHLLRDILTDGDMRYRSAHLAERPREEGRPIRTTDPEVAGHFQDRNRSLERALGEGGMVRLRAESDAYRRLENTMAGIYRDHMAIDAEIQARRDVISAAQEKFGISVDPENPSGLRSAKLILVVLDADTVMADNDATPQEKEDARARQRDVLERLRGFDAASMRQGWHAKAFNGISGLFGGSGAARPDIDALRRLKEVAEAIVYVRETGPRAKLQLEGELPRLGTVLEGLVAARREREPAMGHVTTMIRAAVLAEWQNARTDLNDGGGRVSEGFDPSSAGNRRKIETTLKAWHLDIEAFTPEIDSVLFSRMSPDDIAIWRQQTRFSNAMIERMRRDERPIVDLDRLMGRRAMDLRTREHLRAMLEGFQEGDKFDFKTGQRIAFDTGKVPVEPQGLAFIRARLAQAHIGQFELEMGSDGFKLHVRTGGEGRGSLDGGLGRKFGKDAGLGPALEARLEASIGLEGAASRVSGVSFSFDKGAQGRQALIGLIGRMIDGDPITFKDWQSSTDVGYTYEDRLKGSVTARGEARMGVGGKPDRDKGTNTKLDDEFIGVDAGGGVSAGAAIGGKWAGTRQPQPGHAQGRDRGCHFLRRQCRHLCAVLERHEHGDRADGRRERRPGWCATALRFGRQRQAALQHLEQRRQLRSAQRGSDGECLCRAEMEAGDQPGRPVPRRGKDFAVHGLGGAGGRLRRLPRYAADAGDLNGGRPQDKAFVKELATFMRLKGPRDHIAVSYGPKPGVLDRANALAARTISARRDGDKRLARRCEAAAEAIMHDDDNYMPTKIGLITTDVQKRENTAVSARWIKWDTFSDGKSEHRGVVLNIPGS